MEYIRTYIQHTDIHQTNLKDMTIANEIIIIVYIRMYQRFTEDQDKKEDKDSQDHC